jgi:acetoacetyl-CoA synthetase
MNDRPQLLWEPTDAFCQNARLSHYLAWLRREKQLDFEDYESAWRWSAEQPAAFWESLWEYFEIIAHHPYREVMSSHSMPDTRWFEGSTINYAEHVFRQQQPGRPAIVFQSERQALTEISWQSLAEAVAEVASFLRASGVKPGDRVAAFLPNIPEATIAFLASCAIGAVWSSCSPDFGAQSVLERFAQIEPKVLFAVDGYQYSGKPFDKMAVVHELCQGLPSLQKTVLLPYLDPQAQATGLPNGLLWREARSGPAQPLSFEPLPFDHPIWVLYSSGTTGAPKAITHSHGGVLLEHLKYLAFHNDLHPGERFFWYSTTGWMMWNFVQAALLHGATIALYDGSPAYPDLGVLWDFAAKARIQHFGTSAPYLVACLKAGLQPGKNFDLSALRSIGSTGAPLPPEAFDYVYEAIGQQLWLCSMSGGTDVCTAFVGGCPLLPVYSGEIQCRCLGCALYAYDDEGQPLTDAVGEMVITQPMPSMPIFFWNDPGKEKYLESYFEMYPQIWRHGDWVKVSPRGSLVILGRSDATLNRQGIRIGTAEIYRAVDQVEAVQDSLIVNLELSGGRHYMPLFVVMKEGYPLDEAVKEEIRQVLRREYTPRHVPDEIIAVPELPYTISGKKLETPVKKILLGYPLGKAANPGAMRNPGSLDFFTRFARTIG